MTLKIFKEHTAKLLNYKIVPFTSVAILKFSRTLHTVNFKTSHDKLEPENSANIKFAETSVRGSKKYIKLKKTSENCNLSVFQVTPKVQKAAKEVREIGPDGNCVRRFVIPAVNFRGTDYVDLFDWQACNVTPSTVLKHISCHELLKMIQDDVPMDDWDFIKLPSHTQAVERIVKHVTEACRKRVGPQNRDGFIRATLESIKQMPQFESKK
ncbi:hypothetical protein AVEN_92284-1 [Araneus ventricosus]|uniref:Uncharacterized protein n=1 Tax=Araneus ventricosus TaxID=182803 RepID=A0A4Y2AL57_ARAVE|nr:hypothetical protein AVEN_92284-1 [Araneus ventricosus]